MKIQLLVDNKTRDLKSNLLVASILSKRGAKVFLTPTAVMGKDIFSIKADHVVFNYFRSNNEKIINKVLNCNQIVSILDTEGGFFVKLKDENNVPNFIKTFPSTNFTSKKLCNYFVWGTNVFDFLKSTNYFNESTLKLTGTPRADLLYQALQSSKQKDTILINTSFTLANPKYQSAEKEAQYLIKKYNYTSELTYSVLNSQKDVLHNYINLARKISKSFIKTKIIFRPHPFENSDYYIQFFKDCPNIQISNSSPIDEALASAKVLIHYQCSTAMEAMLVNVPALSLREGADVRSIETINNLTDYYDSHDALIAAIELILQNNYKFADNKVSYLQSAIEKIYFKFDNSASVRIAELLLKSPLKHKDCNSFIKSNKYLLLETIKYLIKGILNKNNLDQSKFFTLTEVNNTLKQLNISNHKLTQFGHTILMEY